MDPAGPNTNLVGAGSLNLAVGRNGWSKNKLQGFHRMKTGEISSFICVSHHTVFKEPLVINKHHMNKACSLALPWIHIQGTKAHNDQSEQSLSQTI